MNQWGDRTGIEQQEKHYTRYVKGPTQEQLKKWLPQHKDHGEIQVLQAGPGTSFKVQCECGGQDEVVVTIEQLAGEKVGE